MKIEVSSDSDNDESSDEDPHDDGDEDDFTVNRSDNEDDERTEISTLTRRNILPELNSDMEDIDENLPGNEDCNN